MNDPNNTVASVPPLGENAPESRWSAWMPFLTSWLLPRGMWFLVYFALVARGTTATRYANR